MDRRMSIPPSHYIVVSMKLGPSKKPRYHQTEEDALAEAERLALLHRDDSFQVYKSHRFVKARMVDVFDNVPCPDGSLYRAIDDDDIPF